MVCRNAKVVVSRAIVVVRDAKVVVSRAISIRSDAKVDVSRAVADGSDAKVNESSAGSFGTDVKGIVSSEFAFGSDAKPIVSCAPGDGGGVKVDVSGWGASDDWVAGYKTIAICLTGFTRQGLFRMSRFVKMKTLCMNGVFATGGYCFSEFEGNAKSIIFQY